MKRKSFNILESYMIMTIFSLVLLNGFVFPIESSANDTAPGQIWTDPITGMEFVWVPGGCYEMGCGSWQNDCDKDELPVHKVCLDGFWIGKYEVTLEQYQKYLTATNDIKAINWKHKDCPFKKDKPYLLAGNNFSLNKNQPVIAINLEGAQSFASWLSASDTNFRLPTEAEWEYACRSGGMNTKFCGQGNINDLSWFDGNREEKTQNVGQKTPNLLGIYDMSGNVWEWTSDSVTIKGTKYSIIKGGAWHNAQKYLRSTERCPFKPDASFNGLGFRLVRQES